MSATLDYCAVIEDNTTYLILEDGSLIALDQETYPDIVSEDVIYADKVPYDVYQLVNDVVLYYGD